MPTEELFEVYWIDLTIPGFVYNRSALHAFGVLSAGLAAHPERSVGIVFAPNTGPYGMEYSDHGMRKSIQEIETLLEDSSLNFIYRDFDLVFDPDTIPKQSRRLGKHKGWIVLNSQCSESAGSLFVQSQLWVRTSVVNVPMTASKFWVNPLQGVRGALDPRKDFSSSAKRKQWLAGWKLAKATLDTLWSNMPLTPACAASIYCLYSYDTSIAEAVLRSSSSVPCSIAVHVCWADMDTEALNHNEKIAKWLKVARKRVLHQLVNDGLFKLDGWQKPLTHDAVSTPRPTYQDSDYTILCPVASGHLPLRAEWLDMNKQKFKSPPVQTAFTELIDNHNKLYNPSGKPHVASSNKRSASAAGLPEGPGEAGIELPEDPSAPKTIDELAKADGPVSSVTRHGQQFIVSKSGHLWVWGNTDDTLPKGLCIMLVFGAFHLNENAAKVKSGGEKVMDWCMTSEDHVGVFECTKDFGSDKFPSDVTKTLAEFLAYLAKHGVVKPSVECHQAFELLKVACAAPTVS